MCLNTWNFSVIHFLKRGKLQFGAQHSNWITNFNFVISHISYPDNFNWRLLIISIRFFSTFTISFFGYTKKTKKKCLVNDCDLPSSKQTSKDFCATTKDIWFFGLGKICENNVGGKYVNIDNNGTMNDITDIIGHKQQNPKSSIYLSPR